MKRSATVLSALALVFGGVVVSPAVAVPSNDPLDVYVAQVTGEQAGELSRQGFDIAGSRASGDKVEVELVLAGSQQKELARRGIDAKVKKNNDGKSARQLAAEQAADGFAVWRSFDQPGGIRDELYALARNNRNLVKLEVLGRTGQGREIIAVKVTQGANGLKDGSRPAVLYSSTQHAREWISTEVNRRLLNHFVNRFKADDTEIKNLLKTTELWFVLVANPDGYQYSFDVERLWRKNLRDNDGNGQITVGDGVDPNRNFDEHFNYDNEGSPTASASDTYRGPIAASEPETKAMQGLLDRIKPKFQSNWHSAGQWILYPQGWQTGSPDAALRCRPLSGSGDNVNDVIEYWFGASIISVGTGQNENGDLFDVSGVANPLAGLTWNFNGTDSARNQINTASFLTTSGLLPVNQYPQFASNVAAAWERPGGPFAPHTGEFYLYSQIGDVSYKRLTRTISVSANGAQLSFWTSYDTEPAWDHLFVEARTAGGDDWTTLPDINGHTTQAAGDSCPEGWRDLHPQLDRYQTLNADGTCSPTGTTGGWHAASGGSGGWQQWNVDLSAYAGGQVEVSVAYVSDWSVQGLGVFVDDVTVSTGEGSTSFESGMDGWAVTGPPAGSAPNGNNFTRTTAAGFPEGAVVKTADTLYFGFGFEGITSAAVRNEVMDRSMEYLLG